MASNLFELTASEHVLGEIQRLSNCSNILQLFECSVESVHELKRNT